MRASRGRAVAASAVPNEAARMREMLVRAGFSETICVFDGRSLLKEAQARLTDLILADALLPGVNAWDVQKRLYSMPLTVYPIVLIANAPGAPPENATCCVLKSPLSESELLGRLGGASPQRRPIPLEKRVLAERMLDAIGIPEHCGRLYLLRAIELAWLDARWVKQLTTRLYPAVAEEFGVDRRHVERSMRHVIDVAWRGDAMDAQYKLFGDTIDARRGSPTLGEMIARIADILRWEGKA